VIDDQYVCIAADLTVLISESKYEISCFDLGGEFLWTKTTLDQLPSTGDSLNSGDPVAINIDGNPLLVTSNDEFMYLSGSMYQLVANSDPACVTHGHIVRDLSLVLIPSPAIYLPGIVLQVTYQAYLLPAMDLLP